MSRFTRALVILVIAALTLVGAAATSSAAEHQRLSTFEDELLVALNDVRISEGLRPLRASQGLQAAALTHSRAMLDGGFFAHASRDGTPFHERIRRFYPSKGWSSWTVAENLLMNTVEIPVDVAIEAWLDSPAHREIMLMPTWREVGIGALHTPVAGGDWENGPAWVVTMDFGARTGQKTSDDSAKAKPKPDPQQVPQSKPQSKPVPTTRRAPSKLPDSFDAEPNGPYEFYPGRVLVP